MSKRILAVGNGDELLEQVNGRVYRHVYDERSKRYITIQEDGASAYAAQLRKTGAAVDAMRLALSGPLAYLERQNMAAIAEADLVDLEMTQAAACGRWGY